MNEITYSKSQKGWILLIIMPILVIYMVLTYKFEWGDNQLTLPALSILSGVFILLMLIFYKLTIYIEGKTIHIKYGIGLIHFKKTITQLHEATVVKTPWYYGWGIRFTPKGVLYNIYGRDAVMIRYSDNSKTLTIMIGTEEPEVLIKHIQDIK